MTWQCKNEHIWENSYGNIKRGRWCSKCAKSSKITLDELAAMVKRGFDQTATKEDTATKDDIKRIEQRIDILEYRVLNSHANRLETLEDDVRRIKTTLGIS